MTMHEIPEGAVEAAAKAIRERLITPDGWICASRKLARAALEAAAPHMDRGESAGEAS